MKVSKRVKAFCYGCCNFGVLIWSVVFLLQGASIQRGAFVCLASLVGMNLLLWFAFKLKENERL